MTMTIMRAERPMLGLPAGIGPPGPWSPPLLLAGLAASLSGLSQLTVAGFAPGGHLPGPALAYCAAGLAATLLSGRAPAPGGSQPQASSPRPAAPAAESSLDEVPAPGGRTHIWLRAGARSMSRVHAAAMRGAAGSPARKRHDLDHHRDARPRDGDDQQDTHGG